MTRRDALRTIGSGFGMLGPVATLGGRSSRGNPLKCAQPISPQKLRVIFLFLNGGPSQWTSRP
jgi:hypothetical protein